MVGESDRDFSAESVRVVAPASAVARSWPCGAAEAVVAAMVSTSPEEAATSAPRRAAGEATVRPSAAIGERGAARCFARSTVMVTWSLSFPTR